MASATKYDFDGVPEVERLDEQDDHDRHDEEHRQHRTDQQARPVPEVEQIVARGRQAESEHGADDGNLKRKREQLFRIHCIVLVARYFDQRYDACACLPITD